MGERMRKIKFRGKTIEQAGMRSAGEWAYGGYFRDDCYGGCPEGKHYIVEWNSTGLGYFAHTRVEKESVSQFTGLRDKNGKEIYEGDVINLYCDCDPGDYAFCTHPPTVHKVVWNEEEAGYDLVQISKGKVFEDFSSYMEESWEVIGNIYENPDLLENEHE